MMSVTEQFRAAIRAAGLTPPDNIEADGKLRRFASNGKKGDDAGWYCLHGDGIPAGSFGDWRTGQSQPWRADIGRASTPAEEAEHRARVEAMRREREAEETRRRAEAAQTAATIWKQAKSAPENHPYLVAKQIKPHGTKQHGDALVIPLRAGGELHSLQFIGPDGDKRFLSGGRVAGCYFSLGKTEGAEALVICEGFATGASIHEATGYPVAVAFNAGNLGAVAKAMREKFPTLPLILCADDDVATEGNPGLTKATEAARCVGGLLAIPDFGEGRQPGQTDFNDMAVLRGLEAVKRDVESATAPNDGTVQPESGNAAAVDCSPPETVPELSERPCFRVFDDWLEHGGKKFAPGVWFFDNKDGGPVESRVCSPLHVDAVTSNGDGNNFGRMLRFRNTLGAWRTWAMPMDMLAGDGSMLRGELLAMGVEISPAPKARTLLASYLQAAPPKRRMRCALQVGWCDDSFVLPDTVIGPKAAEIIFQSGERSHDEHTQAGTLADWQAGISARAIGNPLLVLALSSAFAGPMLARCNAESGGIHFIGDSSTGKTTAIEAACSVWGGTTYKRSWRATANGMEGAAALFNDCLLALDEISECDPREVGAIVYALGNGRGKQRAGRSGNARGVTRWRCSVLSSGERTVTTTIAEGGQRAKAGQTVRLLDIPAARAFGAWDTLHDLENGPAFSDAIKRAAASHHGLAGRAFLERLTHDHRDFCAMLEQFKQLPEFSTGEGEGQDRRAAGRFALLALTGELATEYGVTGWPEGEAIKAAAEGFKAWRDLRGRSHGNDERRQILEQVSNFIERHGDSRFSDADDNGAAQVRDRAGWWRGTHEGREYLFTTAGMREALKGFDFNRALDALQSAGALPKPNASGERSKKAVIQGQHIRVYTINPNKLMEDDHGA